MDPTPSPTPLLVEIANSSVAPWYGESVIAGGFLLGGAIIGFSLNAFLEWRKSKKETKSRYLDKQLDNSSIMLVQTEIVRKILVRVGWPEADTTPSTALYEVMKEARDKIRIASATARSAYTSISLIAPSKLRQAALDLNGAILYARTVNDSDIAADAIIKLDERRKKFEEVCRKQFGAE